MLQIDFSYDKALLDKTIQHTNRVFGNLNIKTTNILFVHGSVDPWRVLGIVDSDPDKAHQVVYIQGKVYLMSFFICFEKNSVSKQVSLLVNHGWVSFIRKLIS